jgi:hypothetical protein
MVYNTQNYWVFGLCPSSGILNNTTFRKLDLFPSAGEGWKTPTQLDPLEREWKRIQFPKRCVFYFLEYRMMDKVQKPSNSEM